MSKIASKIIVKNYNAHGRQDRLSLGILLIILGEFFFVSNGALIKHTTSELPLIQVLFFRNIFGFIFISGIIYRKGFSSLKTQQLGNQILRGVFGLSAMACLAYSYQNLQLSEATLLKATSPLFIPIAALFFLHEKVRAITWFSIFLAFFGVVIIISPELLTMNISLGWLAGIAAAIFAAMAKIFVRKLGSTDSSTAIIFYFATVGTIVTTPFAIMSWQPMEPSQWIFVISIGLVATFGQLCMTKAYTVAPASKIALYGYSSLPFAGALGWFFWQEPVSVLLAFGMIFIIIAGVINYRVKH